MTILVELKSLTKKFGDNILIENVSFSLKKGEITTLIGQNGVGKSTIAKIILGLESYDSGQLFKAANIRIGYVPQILDLSFNMPVTSIGLLKILTDNKSNSNDFNLRFISDLEHIQHKDLSEISGGQLQKLMLAGTIMNRPDLLILDEPTQFLDVSSRQEFYHILGEIKKELGTTIFMISHDLFTVMKNSDRVICLNRHICCSGKPTEVNENIDFKNALSEIGVYIHHHDHKH